MKKDKNDNDISLLGRIFLFFRTLWDKIRAIKLFKRVSAKQKERASYSGDGNESTESRAAYVFGISKVSGLDKECAYVIIFIYKIFRRRG